MMMRDPGTSAMPALPDGYLLDADESAPVPTVRIFARTGELAAIGRVVTVDGWAIYDRIETQPDHRRRGLARIVMAALDGIAGSRNAGRGVLVATAAGRQLYEKIGWTLLSLYITAVIPAGGDEQSQALFNGPESPSAHRP